MTPTSEPAPADDDDDGLDVMASPSDSRFTPEGSSMDDEFNLAIRAVLVKLSICTDACSCHHRAPQAASGSLRDPERENEEWVQIRGTSE
jgi:hypothetical protein